MENCFDAANDATMTVFVVRVTNGWRVWDGGTGLLAPLYIVVNEVTQSRQLDGGRVA